MSLISRLLTTEPMEMPYLFMGFLRPEFKNGTIDVYAKNHGGTQHGNLLTLPSANGIAEVRENSDRESQFCSIL